MLLGDMRSIEAGSLLACDALLCDVPSLSHSRVPEVRQYTEALREHLGVVCFVPRRSM